jgi:hypothetical protein
MEAAGVRLDNPALCVVCDREFDADQDQIADGVDGSTRCKRCREQLPDDEWQKLYGDFYGISVE